jgi:hypothetical protein
MNAHVAVLPRSIRVKWDRIAISQLADRAAQLDDENEDLRRRLYWAEDAAEHWQENAMQLANDGGGAGLTIDGMLVRT